MNNLLKIFLIFNLFSSTTSSVNNSSLPLPETDLKMGQNSSELAERGESLFIYGGTNFTGIAIDRGIIYQRNCTLSFPVITSYGAKGFLTSANCATESVLIGETSVGWGKLPTFIPRLGLDYVFVQVFSDYWSNEVSRKISYSQCSNTDENIINADALIPIINIPNQPPISNFVVYAYGGSSGIVHGTILEFGVEIQTPVPPPGAGYTTYFKNVTKVQMNKNYLPGDLGAPVYTPLRIPNSTQLIASPVGQVAESVGNTTEKNIWYYIPLDRILEDGGLGLATGRP